MADQQVEAYLDTFDGEIRNRLERLRLVIKKEAPDAVESFSYGIIGYKLRGKPLVYIGGFKGHIGFYATPNGHEAFAKEFSTYKQGKGSVQFPISEELPIGLVKRVVAFRKEQVGA